MYNQNRDSKLWECKDGRIIPIKELTDDHLENAVRYFLKIKKDRRVSNQEMSESLKFRLNQLSKEWRRRNRTEGYWERFTAWIFPKPEKKSKTQISKIKMASYVVETRTNLVEMGFVIEGMHPRRAHTVEYSINNLAPVQMYSFFDASGGHSFSWVLGAPIQFQPGDKIDFYLCAELPAEDQVMYSKVRSQFHALSKS